MKVLGICASPRHNGNAHILLENILKEFSGSGYEKEFIQISDYKINPCRECGGCDSTGKCVVDDDMQKIYPKLVNCNILIISSPIFFGGLTSNIKAMIDRCQCLWIKKYILKKRVSEISGRQGGFISICGGKQDFFVCAAKSVKTFFATLDISYCSELFFFEVDKKEDILKKEDMPHKLKEFKERFEL